MVGLSIAVLALGVAVVVLAVGNRREHGQAQRGGSQQEHVDTQQADLPAARERSPLPSPTPTAGLSPSSTLPIGFQNPRKVFRDAFMRGDAESAIAALPDLKRTLGPESHEYLLSVSVLAGAGEEVDPQPLLEVIHSNAVSDESVLQAVIRGAVQYYVFLDRERECLDKIEQALEGIVNDTSRPEDFRAGVANQLQMLYYGVGDMERALDVVTLAIELSPEEPNYYFNLSTIHEKDGDLTRAIAAIERCIELGENAPDRDHFVQAWDLYRQNGDRENERLMERRIDAVRQST